MRFRILAAALVAAASPLAAGANPCPTQSDLETGIRLTRFDPFFSIVLKQTPHGLAEAHVAERNAAPETPSTIYSHPLAVTRRVGATGALELRYDTDTDTLDTLPALREWSTSVTLIANGETLNQGSFTVRIMGFGEAAIGDCSYDVWRIHDSLALDGTEPLRFEKAYAADLGLVVSSILLAPDGSPVTGVFFDEITAE